MNPKTYILIGRSGCGKGTQAVMLEKYLKKNDNKNVLYLETGSLFREFIKSGAYTNKISNEIYKSGGLQPAFLTVNLWASFFVQFAKENQNWIIDGTPRKLSEAKMLDTAINFYKREKPYILFLNLPRESAKARLLERHRQDDTGKDIESRLNWYENEVAETVEYYRNKTDFNFVEINADQLVEKVHEDILKNIGF